MLYVFADEAGNFDFSPSGSKYFIVTSITMRDWRPGAELLALRHELTLRGFEMRDHGFHATDDKQIVREVAITTSILADIYQEEGDLGQASLLYKQALLIAERSVNANHLLLSSLLMELSKCYSKQGRYGEASKLSKRAETLRRQALTLNS